MIWGGFWDEWQCKSQTTGDFNLKMCKSRKLGIDGQTLNSLLYLEIQIYFKKGARKFFLRRGRSQIMENFRCIWKSVDPLGIAEHFNFRKITLVAEGRVEGKEVRVVARRPLRKLLHDSGIQWGWRRTWTQHILLAESSAWGQGLRKHRGQIWKKIRLI